MRKDENGEIWTSEMSVLDESWTNYGPDKVSGRIIAIAFHP